MTAGIRAVPATRDAHEPATVMIGDLRQGYSSMLDTVSMLIVVARLTGATITAMDRASREINVQIALLGRPLPVRRIDPHDYIERNGR